jgi:hypothetical protein
MVASINASTSAGVVTTADTSGILQLQTASTAALTIDASQNVAVGTTTAQITGAGRGNITLNGSSSAIINLSVGDVNKGQFYHGGTDMFLGNQANGYLAFQSNATERMRIDSSGNVLVGATSPYSGTVSNLTATTGVDIGSSSTATSKQLQFIRNGSTGTAGNIYATAGSFSNYCGIEFVIDNVGGGSQAGYLKFNTTNNATSAERMRILSGGSVCVNTTTSQIDGTSRLIVATTTASGLAAEFSNNTSGTATIGISNTGAATSTLINWYAAGSYRAAISWNGSAIVYGTSSDARLKENIVDAGSGLAKLANVKIRSFNWKESGAYTDFGVVAQELQSVAPDAVLVGKDNEDGSIKESWSVDSSVLVPAMIKAIQELKAINDTQAETINALTARIVALEK